VRGEIDKESLVATTTRLGFVNVIDAFHVVNQADVPIRFFIDDRQGDSRGIILTDELLQIANQERSSNLWHEVEGRWRLVETAWSLNMSRNLLAVGFDPLDEVLFVRDSNTQRLNVTSSRYALSGYQKGKCFYCFRDIAVVSGSMAFADVDHFFPHVLSGFGVAEPIDGIWNLVLSCQECNRGVGGKFMRLPSRRYLERLHTRNEFYISSHHPLRETLMMQTGSREADRVRFLATAYREARSLLIHTWEALDEMPPTF